MLRAALTNLQRTFNALESYFPMPVQIVRLSRQERLNQIQFPLDQLPENFKNLTANTVIEADVIQQVIEVSKDDAEQVHRLQLLNANIEEFISRMETINTFIAKSKQEFVLNGNHSNFARLNDIKISSANLPPIYTDQIYEPHVMTYVGLLDASIRCDLRNLFNQWEKDPQNKFKNPTTGQFLKSLVRDHKLEKTINNYVQAEENIAPQLSHLSDQDLQELLAVIQAKVEKNPQVKSYADQLAEHDYAVQDAPDWLRDQRTDNLMTHPILVDGINHFDYETLKSFWAEKPENQYCNPLTSKRICSIQYDDQIKEKADLYCLRPSEYLKNLLRPPLSSSALTFSVLNAAQPAPAAPATRLSEDRPASPVNVPEYHPLDSITLAHPSAADALTPTVRLERTALAEENGPSSAGAASGSEQDQPFDLTEILEAEFANNADQEPLDLYSSPPSSPSNRR